jgi:hypothetical protein
MSPIGPQSELCLFASMERARCFAVLFTCLCMQSLLAQATEPAAVFKTALHDLRGKTRIPIMLPSKLPAPIRESDIKLASGEVRDDGYFISLYFEEIGSNASYAAGFGGSTRTLQATELANTQTVALTHGRTGVFRPVSCGGSCAPAHLWWEQRGVMYQIQIRLNSETSEKDQQKILVAAANSIITAR